MYRRTPGFTLVEILIVVIILGILAAIVIPNVTGFTTTSRESNLKENIALIRANIQVYRNQHAGFPDPDRFRDQMTKATNFAGDTANVRSAEFRFGPYVDQMPANPITGLADIRAAADPSDLLPPGDADGGWWYNPVTGRFSADLTDGYVDQDGLRYNEY